jgi:hypothetical protein
VETVSSAVRGHGAPTGRRNGNGQSSNGKSHNGRAVLLEQDRAGLLRQLRSHRSEIEQAIVAHLCASSDPARDADYLVRLRAAAAAALDYILMGTELNDEWSGTIPSEVVAQAHRAARNGVDLETVLLHCAAGHRVLTGFVITNADGLPTKALGQVLDIQALLVERLMATISIEHKRELGRVRCSPDQRHAQLVRRLLTGELLDTAKLGYDLDAWHIGVIATGADTAQALRGIALSADRQLLSVSHDEDTVWAWFGGKRMLAVSDLECLMPAEQGAGVSLAIGEPARGLDGWRLTHQQAQAARLVALHRNGIPPTREGVTLTTYAQDMLLAAALRDETLASSLREIFLSPLESQRDGGATSFQTLREYLGSGRNASAAGLALGVNRHTVESRLNTAQQHIGRPLDTCLIELEVALRLRELDSAEQPPPPEN